MKFDLNSAQAQLSFELLEVDADPSGNKWYHLRSEVQSKGFSGWSKYWISPSQLQALMIKSSFSERNFDLLSDKLYLSVQIFFQVTSRC